MRPDQMPVNGQRDACAECGMSVRAGEFHPYAACLMFKACGNPKTVKANLDALTHGKDWRITELEAEVERLRKALSIYESEWEWPALDDDGGTADKGG